MPGATADAVDLALKLRWSSTDHTLRASTQELMKRIFSPLCGLNSRVGFMLRGKGEPRLVSAGGELTGVHYLRGTPAPAPNSYHIGGSGYFLEEAVIRTLGETVERYSQMISERSGRHPVVMASRDELVARGEPTIDPERLTFFSDEQLARPGFPFGAFSSDMPCGWVKIRSLVGGERIWVPAQLVMVGYVPKRDAGERWLLSAVTTGSAAHTDRKAAVLNALLELIQIDATMGHWYSAARARRILFDRRVEPLKRLIDRCFVSDTITPRFYHLRQPDLVGITVACIADQGPALKPSVGLGLGSSLNLVEAMYKALLEAVGALRLAKVDMMNRALDRLDGSPGVIDPGNIFDLDQNVSFYADPANREIVDWKFSDEEPICASDLGPDVDLGIDANLRYLVGGFKRSGKQLFFMDLTAVDVRQLGFTAVRVWSPNTLSLSLPSAPPVRHPRFAAYGGANHQRPHPYP